MFEKLTFATLSHSMKKILLLGLLAVTLNACKETEPEPEPAKSSAKAVESFKFLKANNPALEADVTGSLQGTSITLDVPANVAGSEFTATFTVSAKAKVLIGSTEQVSGTTKNNFANPLTYVVQAEDGTTASYTVKVNKSGVAPSADVNQSTSYYLYAQKENFVYTDLSTILQTVHGGYFVDEFAARAFYDFDKDGDADLVAASFNFDANVGFPVHYYKNNGGTFQKDDGVFQGGIPTYVHARQAILQDFDKNGWMDVVIIGHGYDKDPFPGEKQRILMNYNGKFTAKELPLPAPTRLPFTHSGCAGDIDNDGDVDLFFTSNMVNQSGIFLKNDGQGNFSYDAAAFPSDISGKNYYTSVLYDLNGDGYLDLEITGHDNDPNVAQYPNIAAEPMILWGNVNGKYSSTNSTKLPVIKDYGVSNNINILDYNKDGKMDLLITKTGDGAGPLPFYQGYYIQLMKNNGGTSFTDVTTTAVGSYRMDNPPKWIIWLRPHDIDNDGDVDITSEDKFDSHVWINNNGTFAKK